MSFPEAVAKVERTPRLPTESCDTEKENADDKEFVPDSEGEPDEPSEQPQQHPSGQLCRNESKRKRQESDDEAETNARVLRPRQDCASAIMCRSAPFDPILCQALMPTKTEVISEVETNPMHFFLAFDDGCCAGMGAAEKS